MESNYIKIHEEYKIPSGAFIRKIEFEGHTYIYLHNYWSFAGDAFLHDPGCKCFDKEERNKKQWHK